jgi:hypothetical protein
MMAAGSIALLDDVAALRRARVGACLQGRPRPKTEAKNTVFLCELILNLGSSAAARAA